MSSTPPTRTKRMHSKGLINMFSQGIFWAAIFHTIKSRSVKSTQIYSKTAHLDPVQTLFLTWHRFREKSENTKKVSNIHDFLPFLNFFSFLETKVQLRKSVYKGFNGDVFSYIQVTIQFLLYTVWKNGIYKNGLQKHLKPSQCNSIGLVARI